MTTLHEAAQQALEALERYSGVDQRACDAEEALRITLKQEAEAAAWLAERKEHWRKEREKAQTTKDQDPELSAALGWPGGISNPALDRVQLLQMVAALREAAQQALEAWNTGDLLEELGLAMGDLRAALAQEQAEPDLSRCPQCNGPADNGHDRSIPPSPYLCTKCMAEPVQEPIRLDCSSPLVVHPHPAFQTTPPKAEPAQEPWITKEGFYEALDRAVENVRQELKVKTVTMRLPEYDIAMPIIDAYSGHVLVGPAPPRRTMVPLTAQQLDGVIERHVGGSEITDDVYASMEKFARAIEKASWEKNHGQA